MKQLSRSDKLRFGVSLVAATTFTAGAINAALGHRWGTVVILAVAATAAVFMALGTLSKNPRIHRLVSNDWLVSTWKHNNARWRKEERDDALRGGQNGTG
ncbi:hypothetical protein [Mycobacterium branderi]|uniref:UsfY protein n=1 Tax=Mycobacterium branderi TaxID=43348 RepID=A0A7I7WAW6_9MYCO|nr:hypothetical protein [Mycobacterium branderi]MCV7232261.1 hypothetical protein [Mycobacterium branderi]ORA36155.1 hypothetical protein BST20_16505 [Mycobacterium branderi]BBZ14280.1 hypothetical protein MBRA_44750 [Mycobacterium branderi]